MIGYRWFVAGFESAHSPVVINYKWTKGWNKSSFPPDITFNSYGFYSYKCIEKALGEGKYRDYLAVCHILGAIEMAGTIIEHEHGYRSEYARIISFFMPPVGHTRVGQMGMLYDARIEVLEEKPVPIHLGRSIA